MRRNGHKTTFGVKFNLKFDFSVPDFLYVKKFWKLDHDSEAPAPYIQEGHVPPPPLLRVERARGAPWKNV